MFIGWFCPEKTSIYQKWPFAEKPDFSQYPSDIPLPVEQYLIELLKEEIKLAREIGKLKEKIVFSMDFNVKDAFIELDLGQKGYLTMNE